MKMRTSQLYYRVDRRQINLVRFTFEAYEGVGVVSTMDAATGLIRLSIAPGCESVATEIMEDLGCQFPIEPVAPEKAEDITGWRNAHGV
jgi:hypothetical protein